MCVYTSQPRTCKMYGYTVCGKTITLTEASSSTEADLHSFPWITVQIYMYMWLGSMGWLAEVPSTVLNAQSYLHYYGVLEVAYLVRTTAEYQLF